jgi:hypothetical protein
MLKENSWCQLDDEKIYLRQNYKIRPMFKDAVQKSGLRPDMIEDAVASRNAIRYQVELGIGELYKISELLVDINEIFILQIKILKIDKEILDNPADAGLSAAKSSIYDNLHKLDSNDLSLRTATTLS